jgi:DNA-binding transcriptional LysR family regulator
MELYQLRSFATVAREGHLTRAAGRLNVSQPAVSAHIKALEEKIGLSLFLRTPTGMQLTAGGRKLSLQAEKILHEVDEFISLGERLSEQPVGVLRIGLNRGAEFLRISPLYQQLRSSYPKLEIILQQSVSGTIIRMIRTEDLDCGFILGRYDGDDLSLVELARFKLRVVGPVALQEELSRSDHAGLAEFPWIGIPDDAPYHRIMQRYFIDQGMSLATEVVADQQSAILSMIESGAGLSFMLDAEAAAAEEQGRLAVWPGGSFPVELFFVYRTRDRESLKVQVVTNMITGLWSNNENNS